MSPRTLAGLRDPETLKSGWYLPLEGFICSHTAPLRLVGDAGCSVLHKGQEVTVDRMGWKSLFLHLIPVLPSGVLLRARQPEGGNVVFGSKCFLPPAGFHSSCFIVSFSFTRAVWWPLFCSKCLVCLTQHGGAFVEAGQESVVPLANLMVSLGSTSLSLDMRAVSCLLCVVGSSPWRDVLEQVSYNAGWEERCLSLRLAVLPGGFSAGLVGYFWRIFGQNLSQAGMAKGGLSRLSLQITSPKNHSEHLLLQGQRRKRSRSATNPVK